MALPAGTPPWVCPQCLLDHATAGEPGAAPVSSGTPAATSVSTGPLGGPLPCRLGAYELVERIGQGGMGVVYKARQISLDRDVAVKVLSLAALAGPEAVHRFRTEAVTAGSLRHPNIVVVHEVGLAEGQHYLVMDYVPGPTLADLTRNGPLPARRAAQYLRTIAEAVHFAHERGILHRDLKPSNVLIDTNDQPRVTDFGLAKRFISGPVGTRSTASHSSSEEVRDAVERVPTHVEDDLTLSGQVLGSPAFIPPEQASGQRGRVGRRSDVYALGAILYQLLTGRPPFVGEALADTLRQVLNEEPPRPRLLNPTVPLELETIGLKCLEKEPDRRYPTAQALAEELGRWLENRPILARPVGLADKVWRWCRRKPALASLGAGVIVLLLVVAIGSPLALYHINRARLDALEQTQRAEAEALLTRRNSYAADMNLVQRALEESDLSRALELLDRHRPLRQSEISNFKFQIPADLRGWEWRYLWARCQSDERFTLCQSSNSVSALAFSADGQWLAVRHEDGVVALWDTLAKRSVTNLPARAVRWRWCNKALAFSPREPLLAWGNTNASGAPILSLRDLGEQKEIARLPHSADVVSVAFSPDAKVLATLDYDGTVRVWDVESQQVVTNFPTAPVDVWAKRFAAAAQGTSTSVVGGIAGPGEPNSPSVRPRLSGSKMNADHYGCVLFSPDGQWLAIGEAAPRIRLLNRVTGELREIPVRTEADGITALAFSPDSKRLAAGFGAGDNDVHVWDLGTGTETRLAGHSGWIVGLAFSPDGQTLASASSDQTLRLWEVTRNTERRRFHGHTDEVWALAWSPIGQDLVTGGRDGSVRYWDPAVKAPVPYAVLPASVHFWGLAFSPDSKTFLTVTLPGGAVVQWDTASLQRVEELRFLGTNHLGVDLSRDGRWLALGDKVGNTQVWDFLGRRLVTNLVSQETSVFALISPPGGNLLNRGAASSNRRTVPKLWRVDGWQEISLQGINLEKLFEADCSPDERTLAIAYGDGTVAWWDLATGQRQAQFDSQYSHGVHVAFSPDGRLFATAGLNGLMKVWEVATRRAKLVVRGHRNALHDLVFSPDGSRLVASGTSLQGPVKLWDVETGRDVATLPGEPGWYGHIGFSPDGNTLFAGSLEGTALLWRAPSWEEIEAAEKTQKTP